LATRVANSPGPDRQRTSPFHKAAAALAAHGGEIDVVAGRGRVPNPGGDAADRACGLPEGHAVPGGSAAKFADRLRPGGTGGPDEEGRGVARSRTNPCQGRRFTAEGILRAARRCLRFPIRCRGLEPMLADRGAAVDHATRHRRIQAHAPALDQRLRPHRRPATGFWRVDETDLRMKGRWRHRPRADDRPSAQRQTGCRGTAVPPPGGCTRSARSTGVASPWTRTPPTRGPPSG
jgi:hypothetical protein